MRYVTRKCPYCGYTFERLKPDYIGLGNPYKKCPKCRRHVRFDNINEWELMGFWKKFNYILAIIWSTLLLCVGIILGSYLILLILSNYFELLNIVLGNNIKYLFSAGIVIYVFSKSIKLSIKEINESKIRTKNEKYYNLLYKLQQEEKREKEKHSEYFY
ncbi:MAG: hypothetical protein ACOCRK_08580 [bacterium]